VFPGSGKRRAGAVPTGRASVASAVVASAVAEGAKAVAFATTSRRLGLIEVGDRPGGPAQARLRRDAAFLSLGAMARRSPPTEPSGSSARTW
jgi:hypothetical protein